MADVNTHHPHYDELARRWDLPRTLLGGTWAMRQAGETYLPRHPKEKLQHWEHRRDRTVLWGHYEDAIENITGKPFSQEVVASEDTDPRVHEWAEDVDLEGTTLTWFGRELFRDALIDGKAHILVDFPKDGAPVQTIAQRERAGLRPWLVRVPALSAIDWRATSSSPKRLTRVTIRELDLVEAEEWQQQEQEQFRVWWGDRWAIYAKSSGSRGEYGVVAEGNHVLGMVPMVTLYFNRTSFFEALPPLERLAWLEVSHWQSRSEQTHILEVARVPGVMFKGWTGKGEPEWGPNRAYGVPADGDIKFVEHSGAAVAAGRTDLQDIEARMRAITAATMTAAPGDVKATAMALDSASTKSWIQALAQATEQALEQAFTIALRWMGTRDGKVDLTVNSEFDLPAMGDDVDDLIKTRAMGEISQETFLAEMRRRGRLDDKLDIDAEIEATQNEVSRMQIGAESGLDDDDEPPVMVAAE